MWSGRALTNAIEHAHRQGVVHGDVKPSNVMIDDDRLLLTPPLPPPDFGGGICGHTREPEAVIAGPFVNVLVFLDGPLWLTAYATIIALGAVSTGLAVLLTIGMFRLLGPKLTRTVSQIVAAVIGAAFVIGVQVAAIMSDATRVNHVRDVLQATLGHTGTVETNQEQRAQLVARVRELNADLVLFDLAAGTDRFTLDFFLEADESVVITTPEPTALENAYAILKASFYRRLANVPA